MQRAFLIGGLLLLPLQSASAGEAPVHFDPDTDPSRLDWFQLQDQMGTAPDVRGERFGAVLKTQTNEYWRLIASGYRTRAASDGVKLDIQAAQTESDPILQLAIMEAMIGSQYKGLLISPQSGANLQSAIDDASIADVPIVNVDGAVVDSVTHFVGAMNRDMGVRVAEWYIKTFPKGGKVAVIKGQAGVFSTVKRTAGFIETLIATKRFDVVAMTSGEWDRLKSYDAAMTILKQTPDLIGFYCNNDVMALGVVDAVKTLGRLEGVRVFGTDGTHEAYASIQAGELTGTVDIFPKLTGEIGLDIAERLSVGQQVPRVIVTPQALVTRDNMVQYEVSDDALRLNLMRDARLHASHDEARSPSP